MPIYTRKKQFETAPAGLHAAVCVDVVDLGIIDNPKWGPQEKIKIVWQLAIENKKGDRFLVNRKFTPSLGKKSHLRPILESWRGKPFTNAEQNKFDIESLVGVNCQISVVHNMGDDESVWANISAVVPPAKGSEKLYPMNYTREIDREGYIAPQQPAEEPEYEEPVDESDVPF